MSYKWKIVNKLSDINPLKLQKRRILTYIILCGTWCSYLSRISTKRRIISCQGNPCTIQMHLGFHICVCIFKQYLYILICIITSNHMHMQNFVFCETLFEHFKFLMYDCLNGYYKRKCTFQIIIHHFNLCMIV